MCMTLFGKLQYLSSLGPESIRESNLGLREFQATRLGPVDRDLPRTAQGPLVVTRQGLWEAKPHLWKSASQTKDCWVLLPDSPAGPPGGDAGPL